MLTPNEVLILSEPVEQMYADCASQLLINIARHFTLDGLSTAQEWRIRRLAEMGQLTRESVRIIARTTGQSEETIRATLERAAGMSLADLENLMERAVKAGKISGAGELFTSSRVRSVLDAMTTNAQNSMNLVNTTMLRSTLDSYRAAITQVFNMEEAQAILNQAAGSVALSVEARRDAVRQAIKGLADKGITGYVDKAGRNWTPEAYVNMVVRTTVHNTSIEVEKERAADYDVNTFQISLKTPARPLCAPYIGWICSWDGTTGTFTDLYGREYTLHSIHETSYGEPAGIFGINCGHDPITVVDGFSIIRDEPLSPEQQRINEEVYQQTQTMRGLERDVRKLKTEALAYNAAGDKEAFDKTALRIRNKTDQYKAYCASNGLRERPDKLQVVGYNRSISGSVNAAARRMAQLAPAQEPRIVIPEFVAAKTKAEAVEYARRFARNVDFGRISLDNINRINEQLNVLTAKYPIKELQKITPKSRGVMSANFQGLNINGAKIGKVLTDSEFNFKLNQAMQKAEISVIESRYPNGIPRDVRKRIDDIEYNLKFDRWGANSRWDDLVKGTVTHEYGHILSDQYFSMINDRANPNVTKRNITTEKWNKLYSDSIANGDIYKISRYGGTNAHEFFAESFAMYEHGDEMPSKIKKLMEETLKNGPM